MRFLAFVRMNVGETKWAKYFWKIQETPPASSVNKFKAGSDASRMLEALLGVSAFTTPQSHPLSAILAAYSRAYERLEQFRD